MRQIVLDTETTGLNVNEGHRLIEIGAVELIDRQLTDNIFHIYLNPQREIDAGAIAVHGITNAQLENAPLFAEIAESFLSYLQGAQLIIHNASFDIGFINAEFNLLAQKPGIKKFGTLESYCQIIDSLQMAREMFPGQRNSLDALCKRYHIDNTQRTLHGALLDAQLLAQVYLSLTGGQASFSLNVPAEKNQRKNIIKPISGISFKRDDLVVIQPTPDEWRAHQARLQQITDQIGENSLWQQLQNIDQKN